MTSARRDLDPALAADFRRLLVEARARLIRTVATTDEELATLEAHQPGAPIEDAAREEILRILSRLEDREQRELEAISLAHAKLHAGTFGTCETCGQPIPLARLRAVPTARHCVGCQAQQEG